ncbi:MAG: hypothetical protein H8E14_13015 [Candidatus Marinimicrobia bacterium]|nr:hypothetical protein [Candidatus Neomarinimicrobiota bacterium]
MKNKLVTPLIIIVGLVSGCVSINVNRFHNHLPVPQKLPLALEMDHRSFTEATSNYNYKYEDKFIDKYGDIIDDYMRMYPHLYQSPKDFFEDYQLSQTIKNIDKKQDYEIEDFVEDELKDNYLEPTDEPLGFIKCRLAYRKTKIGFRGYFYLVTSSATIFSLNLLGYPFLSQTTDLRLEVEIFDMDGLLVKRYEVEGNGTVHCAMYWGYSMVLAAKTGEFVPLPRGSYLKALKKAFRKLRPMIQNDTPLILENL